ncbi:MAG: Vps62-related protein [Acidimicrobiales bacterium]
MADRRRRWWRFAGVVLVLAVVLSTLALGGPAGAQSAEGDTGADATELAERYAPIIMIKAQEAACDVDGEPYGPTSVDIVLDNPEVLLRQVGNGDPVLQAGPGADDLFGLGEGFFLDFPGSSLEPGCIYERDFERYGEATPATVYAHIVTQDGHPNRLAVQYWFYWYYNDWNNKHESDWEGIQLVFDASSITDALASEPSSIGFAQHEGGERADWNSDKLERSGTHPVVYSSAGSHASYFGSAIYLGRSGGEGFGCDTTDGPSDRLEPAVVVLPDRIDDPTDELAWLAFDGRWGERQRGAFNGPTGPAAKDRWLEPMDWHDELRTDSVVIPGGGPAAGVVTTFCGVVEAGSRLLISFTLTPARILLALGLTALFARWLIRRTDWGEVPPLPIRRERAAGQILRGALELSVRGWASVVVFGVVYVPATVLVAMLGALLAVLPLSGELAGLAGRQSGTSLVLAVFAGGLPHLIAVVTVNALVATSLDHDLDDQREGRREATRQVWSRKGALAGGLGRAFVVVVGLLITVVGIPLAIRQLIRYQFVPQVIMLEGVSGRRAMARSSELVAGRWWNTAAVIGVINVGVTAAALVFGLLLLVLVAGLPLWLFSAAISLIYGLVVPPAAAAQTLLYGNAVAESGRSTEGLSVGESV